MRYKGNGTILETMRVAKKSIKLDLDRHNSKLEFDGLNTINLHSGVTDPSKARETLGYAAYRAAGVPAPRTGLAEVTLTVPGKYDREYLGLFTIVEPIDKPFLKHHYKSDKGLLMKPERVGGLNYLGEDWERYKTTYQPKRDATPAEQKRVMDFTRFVNQSSDESFAREIGSYIDVDAFLRFMAVTALEANMDSFFTLGHNYCLYLHPDTNKFHFIPWDLDRSFANFGIFGTPEQMLDLSIMKPAPRTASSTASSPSARTTDAIARSSGRSPRQASPGNACSNNWRRSTLRRRTSAPAMPRRPRRAVKQAPARRGRGSSAASPRCASSSTSARSRSPPSWPGRAGGSSRKASDSDRPEEVVRAINSRDPLLDAVDANKDGRLTEAEVASGMKRLFGEWDLDRNGSLDQKELADGLQKLVPAPKGGFGGFGGPPKGGFGGFGGPPKFGPGAPSKGGFPPGKPPESPMPRPLSP